MATYTQLYIKDAWWLGFYLGSSFRHLPGGPEPEPSVVHWGPILIAEWALAMELEEKAKVWLKANP